MTDMPKNEDVMPAHVCPGMRIQVIDIVQPPGTGIPHVADMDFDQRTVAAVLTNEEPHHDSDERAPGIAFHEEVRPFGDPGLEGGKLQGP